MAVIAFVRAHKVAVVVASLAVIGIIVGQLRVRLNSVN